MKGYATFALTIALLVVLASGSFADSVDFKAIAGTEFTLLSNTEQCLANCEAWIEWDLSDGILTDVQLPIAADSLFSFEIVKETIETKDLEDFGVEVWEEKTTEVTDFCWIPTPYDTLKPVGLDLNGQEQSCETIGCVYKDKDYCTCTQEERKPCGSHIETSWVKVSDDFFGFKAVKGKVYRLRVWGKRKASLERNAIDWIPTFFGETISEWAWWGAGAWGAYIPITLNTSDALAGDVTQDMVIAIDINSEQTDFWAYVQEDGKDVRFIASDETTEYDFYFEQFDYDNQKAVAWVEITETFPSASDLTIYAYYANPDAADGQSFRRNVYPDLYMGGWDFNELSGTTGYDVVDSDTNNLVHANTPTLDSNGVIDGAIKYDGVNEGSSINTFLDTKINAMSFSFWFVPRLLVDNGLGTPETLINKDNDGTNEFKIYLADAVGSLQFFIKSNGVLHTLNSSKTSWAAGTWFHVVATFDEAANAMNLYVDNSTVTGGTLAEAMEPIAAGTTSDFFISRTITSFDGNMDAVRVYNRVLTSNEVALIYASEIKALAVFGDVETRAIDLNISTINGLSFKTHPMFAFGLDGNVTIDFNVFHQDNKRLTIDLRYSVSETEGSGTSIVEDLNLTSDYCTDQDWDDGPSECSYSWNYSSATDGNYVITGLITDGGITDFNASDANFQIANDVNLIVLAPIDEDTGFQIPTSTIGYSVKITTEDTIKFYDDMIDLNSFLVPFQSTPILVKVDVNVADEYYSRQYSISFTEVTPTYTLQPYLAPVAESGNFIFYVTNLTTTGPLSDVTIIIDGIVPGADGVVIQEIVTDAAGTATIPLLLDTEYSATFFYNGILVHEAIIVPTAGSLTYQVGLNIISTIPTMLPIGSLIIDWSPTTLFLIQNTNGGVDINLSITLQNKDISRIQTRVLDTNGCLYDQNFFDAPWTDGNTVYYYGVDLNTGASTSIYTGLPCIYNNDLSLYSLYVTVDVNSTDGNAYSARSISWQILTPTNYQWNVWYRLGLTANSLNAEGSKATTSLLAFFIVFIIVMILGKTVGNTFISAIVGLLVLGLFVLLEWFDFAVFAFIAFATVMYAMYVWGKTG